MKFEVIYKFLLLCVLIISLLCVVISGVGLLWGWQIGSLLNVHISFALLLVAGLLLHVLNRKNKLAICRFGATQSLSELLQFGSSDHDL